MSEPTTKRSPLRYPQMAMTVFAPIAYILDRPALAVLFALLAVANAILILADER